MPCTRFDDDTVAAVEQLDEDAVRALVYGLDDIAAVDEEASSDNGKHVHLRKRSKIAAIPAEISYGDALMTEHTCTSKQSEAHKSRNAGLRHRLLLNR